jgi:hypothetical protein
MSTARYSIPDEPHPSRLERWVVDPMWPFFGLMLGGLWLALPWYVFNGLALGSPTRGREWLALAVSLVGSIVLVLALDAAHGAGLLDGVRLPLSLLSLTLLKLGMGFAVFSLQARSFQLWQHFGGVPRNGIYLAIAGIFIEPRLFGLTDNVLIKLVLA